MVGNRRTPFKAMSGANEENHEPSKWGQPVPCCYSKCLVSPCGPDMSPLRDDQRRGSSVSIVTRTRVSLTAGASKGFFFSSPPSPDWLCDPPSLLSNGYRVLFHRE
jgi:hypothetical protein